MEGCVWVDGVHSVDVVSVGAGADVHVVDTGSDSDASGFCVGCALECVGCVELVVVIMGVCDG